MIKLYHYAPIKNTVLTEGLYSFAMGKGVSAPYIHRVRSGSRDDIVSWMEKCFPGRSRAISALTEPIRWKDHDPVLKKLVEQSQLFSFDLNRLMADRLVESVWCKNGSKENGVDEVICRVDPMEIDFSALPWEKCCAEKCLIYAVIRHYFIVLNRGFIPPEYLKQEDIDYR